MTLASVQSGHYYVDVGLNMWWGTKQVKVNGKLVSSRYSFCSDTHTFTLPNAAGELDEFRVDFRFSWWSFWGVCVDVIINDECVLNQSGKGEATALAMRRNALPEVPREEGLRLRELAEERVFREEDLV